MADDHPPPAVRRRYFKQPSRHEFIGQTMEAVTPHPFVIESPWQRIGAVEAALRPVERRIETGDLWYAGKGCTGGSDAREIVRLVKRCQWNERGQLLDHLRVDHDGSVGI